MASKIASKSRLGKIKSVYCKHFVTYEEVIFHPGEYLNILIGPNGTGKSTIVSAIVLGLGGEPQLLNRSHLISEYIKSGRNSAKIIITIYGADEGSICFCREFNDSNESQFFIDDNRLSKKKFMEKVAEYNMQIGNLCQFLPQDRVQDFLKMNPQELLSKTMISVCDKHLIDDFEQLKMLRKEQLCGKNTRQSDFDHLEQLKLRLDQLQSSVNHFNERNEFQDKINVYTSKKLWLEVNEVKQKASELGKDYAAANHLYETHKQKYDEMKMAQDNVMKLSERLKKESVSKEQLIAQATNTKNKLESEIESLKSKIQEGKTELERSLGENAQNEAKLRQETQMLETILKDLTAFNESLKDVQNIKIQHESTLRELNEKISQNIRRRVDINRKLDDDYLAEVNMLKNKMGRLENVTEQKLQMFHTRHPDLWKAVHWLRDNQSIFEQKVYNPMILELNIPDARNAKYFENTIHIRDLLAFTCESTIDLSKLTEELRVKQGLNINVIYSPPAERCMHSPKVSIDVLRSSGFTSYMVDLVEGPAPILNKLCASYNIQNIPIGSESATRNTNAIPNHIRQYFLGSKRFTVTNSKYRPDSILTERFIEGKNLLSTVDLSEIPNLRARLNEVIKKTDVLRNERSNIEATINDIEYQRKRLLEEKSAIDSKFLRKEQLLKDFNRQNKKVKDLRLRRVSVDELDKRFKVEAKKNIELIFEKEKKRVDLLVALQAKILEKNIASAKEYIYKNETLSQTNHINQAQEEMTSAKNVVDNICSSLEKCRTHYKQKSGEAKKLSNNCEPNDPNFPYKLEFQKLSSLSLDQVKDFLVEQQARLECMANVNNDVVIEFNNLEAEIEELQIKISSGQSKENDLDKKMRAIYTEWEPRITEMIEIISKQFSHFMESINCVGDVLLSKQDEFDFDSYGIQIMVQYRKNTQLQTLDKHLQSGGERAVAIAIYTLSLQHITHVPFRCVDEINQGMDPKNERSILEMLLRETTKNGSSQYLFVTPKLLRNLSYNQRVSVSVVHNGSFLRINEFVQ